MQSGIPKKKKKADIITLMEENVAKCPQVRTAAEVGSALEIIQPESELKQSFSSIRTNTSDTKCVGFLFQTILQFSVDINWVSYNLFQV